MTGRFHVNREDPDKVMRELYEFDLNKKLSGQYFITVYTNAICKTDV